VKPKGHHGKKTGGKPSHRQGRPLLSEGRHPVRRKPDTKKSSPVGGERVEQRLVGRRTGIRDAKDRGGPLRSRNDRLAPKN